MVRIWCGTSEEPEELGWARQPKSLPGGGNRANQALIGGRKGQELAPVSGYRPLIPDYDFS